MNVKNSNCCAGKKYQNIMNDFMDVCKKNNIDMEKIKAKYCSSSCDCTEIFKKMKNNCKSS